MLFFFIDCLLSVGLKLFLLALGCFCLGRCLLFHHEIVTSAPRVHAYRQTMMHK